MNAGASGAVFGLLGVLYVELFQFWQIVDRAWLELLKLSAFVVFLLTLGTLPYVDNMSHVGMLYNVMEKGINDGTSLKLLHMLSIFHNGLVIPTKLIKT